MIKFFSDLRQVCGFARVLRFPPPIKLTARIFEIGAKHHPLNPYNFVCYKADESINEELEAASVIKRRVDHLKEAELLHPHTKPLWHKKRLDRMLVEYFLRAGFYNTAIKLAQQSEIEVYV